LRNVKYKQVFKRWEKGTEREREKQSTILEKKEKEWNIVKEREADEIKEKALKCETKKGKFNQVRNIIYVQVFER
jgi:hypothetical protein